MSVVEVMVTSGKSATALMHWAKVTVPVTVTGSSLKKVHEDNAIIAKMTIDFILYKKSKMDWWLSYDNSLINELTFR